MVHHGRSILFDCLKSGISQSVVRITTEYTSRQGLLVVEIQQHKLGTTTSIYQI